MILALFLLALSVVCFLLAVHPFVTYPLSLRWVKKSHGRPVAKAPDAPAETYAICVCAYNEEAVIREKAENLLQLKQAIPGLEIFIYVDCASDRTAEILSEYKNEFDIHVATERHGKTYGMNLLVAKAKASVIIFSDANVILDVNSIPNLQNYFADPSVGCVCGHLRYINSVETETSQNGSLYWRMEESLKQLESDTGSIMGADGSIFAIRRALHVPPPADMIDDMYVSFSILCQGYRIVRAQDVIAYEESVTVAQEEFRRKVRIACQAFNIHRHLWPKLRQLPTLDLYKYISHKWLRWLTIYWLGLSALFFVLAAAAIGYGVPALILVLAGIALIVAGLKVKIPVVTQIADIIYAFLGVGVGVWKSYTGERFQTWSPANSIRKKA